MAGSKREEASALTVPMFQVYVYVRIHTYVGDPYINSPSMTIMYMLYTLIYTWTWHFLLLHLD